jgi:hypothetical protein
MVMQSNEVFIWIPRNYTPKTSIKITHGSTETDISDRVIDGKFVKIATSGIGNFKIRMINASGTYTDMFEYGDTVKFYGDYTDGTTLKFYGRIDFIKEVINYDGKFLDMEGRHIAYPVMETIVNKSYIDKTIDYMLKDIIDEYLSGLGFTYTNVETFSNTFSKTFSNLTVWDCVKELCLLDLADCYIDDDKDFHMFTMNTVLNSDDAIVEGNTLITFNDFGKDDSIRRDKIIVYGQDENGLPIISQSGDGDRMIIINNANINTDDEAKNLADAKLEELNAYKIHGTCMCYGMPYIIEGENLWVSIPRSEIHGIYKVSTITHTIKRKFWTTECLIESLQASIGNILASRISAEKELYKASNINDMRNSYSFSFSDSTNISSLSGMEISGGNLKLSSGYSEGEMITENKTSSVNITKVELKYYGKDLGNTNFYVTVDGGLNYEQIYRDTLKELSFSGKVLNIKIEMSSDALNVNPEIDSMSLLYV